MFAWKEGSYEFIPQGVPIDKDLGISLNTQHILMEGLRILDEWSVIEGLLTLDTIFMKTSVTISSEEEITEEEKKVLSFVDGENDVSTIVDLSDLDDLTTSKTLSSLLEKRLIVTVKKPEKKKEATPERRKYAPLFMAFTIPVLIIIFLTLSVITLVNQSTPLYEDLAASRNLEFIRLSIESFRASNGNYPEALPEIGTIDAWGSRYFYAKNDSGYTLFSAGPDGTPYTDDDIF
jgi:hypothetical protein